jgi:hypothetical protein
LARAAVHAVDKSLKDDQVIYRQMQIVFCGHSKGGAEASRAQQEAMALMEQDLGISKAISISKATYNAAPDFIRKPVTNKQEDLNIQIRNKHDFVSAANPNSVTIDTETKNPIKAHSEYIKASLFHLIDVVCEKEMHQHFNNISSILENSIISRCENRNNNLSHRASGHTTGRPNM